MSDIFREVDDGVRQQKLEILWKKYGFLLIIGAFAVVFFAASWRFYQHRQQQAAEASSEQFQSALQLIKTGKIQEAEPILSLLAQTGTPSYRTLAKFRNAADLSSRNLDEAVKNYDDLASDASLDKTFQDLARIRAASLLVDSSTVDNLVKRIGSLANSDNLWRNSARELLGLAQFKAGNLTIASSYFEQIALDPQTPQTMRERAQLLLSMFRGGQVTVQ